MSLVFASFQSAEWIFTFFKHYRIFTVRTVIEIMVADGSRRVPGMCPGARRFRFPERAGLLPDCRA